MIAPIDPHPYLPGIEPGRYLVGREDGTVEPFWVHVADDGNSATCDDTNALHLDHACENSGW